MRDPQAHSAAIFNFEFTVGEDALDDNGHVNNVMYVQWMQDAAVRHYESMGGAQPTQPIGATWVVRSHKIEYLTPAFAGDRVRVLTWIANIRKVRSLRRYRFLKANDGQLLVRGETDWVFVDAKSGRPRAVPNKIADLFTFLPEMDEPS